MKKKLWKGSRHLPEELWTQIFCILPVKSLLVVRSVCKSFLSIIDDSNFISLHLRIFPDNLHETLTLVRIYDRQSQDWKICFVIRDSNGIEVYARLDPGLAHLEYRILTGSHDGLKDGPEMARLWNPSTRKIRTIPLPKNPLSSSNVKGMRRTGLAYDSSCGDYKVLYIAYEKLFLNKDRLLRPLGVWVYSVKTRSWTTLNMEKYSELTRSRGSPWSLVSLFFQCALLWVEGWYRLRMVRFEVGTNKFRYYTNLPLTSEKHKNMESMLVTLDGGSILGLCGLNGHNRFSVWAEALDGDVSCWVIRCVIHQFLVQSFDNGTYVRVSKDEELMWTYHASDGTHAVFTYNLRTLHCQRPEITPSASVLYEAEHCAHVQSLVKL